jgi:AcrR family transcriptional regulator
MEPRERILQAAAELYGETGFRGTTTRRIAERAGVNEITLFRHFGSKTRLLHEAIKCAGAASHRCELSDPSGDPRADLAVWATANHRELSARRSLIRTAMGEIGEHPDILPRDQSPTVCAALTLNRYLTRLKETHRIAADVDVGAAGRMFLGTLFADAISRDVLPELYPDSPESSVRHYVELFARAIGLKETAP